MARILSYMVEDNNADGFRQEFPDQVKSDIEQEATLEGDLDVLHSDGVDDPKAKEPHFKDSKFYYFLKTSIHVITARAWDYAGNVGIASKNVVK